METTVQLRTATIDDVSYTPVGAVKRKWIIGKDIFIKNESGEIQSFRIDTSNKESCQRIYHALEKGLLMVVGN